MSNLRIIKLPSPDIRQAAIEAEQRHTLEVFSAMRGRPESEPWIPRFRRSRPATIFASDGSFREDGWRADPRLTDAARRY
jgi:hypothetical protein